MYSHKKESIHRNTQSFLPRSQLFPTPFLIRSTSQTQESQRALFHHCLYVSLLSSQSPHRLVSTRFHKSLQRCLYRSSLSLQSLLSSITSSLHCLYTCLHQVFTFESLLDFLRDLYKIFISGLYSKPKKKIIFENPAKPRPTTRRQKTSGNENAREPKPRAITMRKNRPTTKKNENLLNKTDITNY